MRNSKIHGIREIACNYERQTSNAERRTLIQIRDALGVGHGHYPLAKGYTT